MNPMLELARSEGHRPRMPRTEGSGQSAFTDHHARALDFLRKNPSSTIRDIRIAIGLTPDKTQTIIGRFVRHGDVTFTEHSGHGKKYFRRYSAKVSQ